MKCTFFGHRDTPADIQPILENTITDLIKNKNVNIFYVGNHGNFDRMVKNTLEKLKKQYPHISYRIVLAYIPNKKDEFDYTDYSVTICADGIEHVPPKTAIIKRNIWMISKCDYVITYIKNSYGNAWRFGKCAEKMKKSVINLLS